MATYNLRRLADAAPTTGMFLFHTPTSTIFPPLAYSDAIRAISGRAPVLYATRRASAAEPHPRNGRFINRNDAARQTATEPTAIDRYRALSD